jgi:3-hydroxyisobutyrate dehydrogenase-like beta-hydroxyacid dehydrogenase
MEIGFIGLGLMGEPMARNVLKKYKVNLFNRTKQKANNLVEMGAVWKNSPKDVCNSSDITIIMLSDNKACEEIFFNQDGVVSASRKDSIIINMSTITPEMSIKLSKTVQDHELAYIEAPVSGTTGPAKAGTLKIYYGGEKSLFEKVEPVLSTMGDKITFIGEIGKASLIKLLINANLAVQMAILSETLYIAEKNGFSKEDFLEIIQNSAVSTRIGQGKAQNLLKEEYPVAFPYELIIKDLNYGLTLGKEEMKMIKGTRDLYFSGLAFGLGRKDFSAIYELYKQMNHSN